MTITETEQSEQLITIVHSLEHKEYLHDRMMSGGTVPLWKPTQVDLYRSTDNIKHILTNALGVASHELIKDLIRFNEDTVVKEDTDFIMEWDCGCFEGSESYWVCDIHRLLDMLCIPFHIGKTAYFLTNCPDEWDDEDVAFVRGRNDWLTAAYLRGRFKPSHRYEHDDECIWVIHSHSDEDFPSGGDYLEIETCQFEPAKCSRYCEFTHPLSNEAMKTWDNVFVETKEIMEINEEDPLGYLRDLETHIAETEASFFVAALEELNDENRKIEGEPVTDKISENNSYRLCFRSIICLKALGHYGDCTTEEEFKEELGEIDEVDIVDFTELEEENP